MFKSQFNKTQESLKANKEILSKLLEKRANLDQNIRNLENKIQNQEAILQRTKIEDLKEDPQ